LKKIYIAGPEVFLEHAIEEGKRLKALCQQYGYEGMFPMDNEIPPQAPHVMAKRIQEANIAMIRSCDIVIANLSSFRGAEPDSDTVWEVGFAQALGKTVLAYSNDLRSLKTKTQAILSLGNSPQDNEGYFIEDFGLSHNLMFAPCVIAETFEACLETLGQGSESPNQVILQLGNPLLRHIANRVHDVTNDATQALIQTLLTTCQASKGVGIAAPQLGISQAIFIMASYPNERYPNAPLMEPMALINPMIRAHSDLKEKEWEGCLSIPGIRAKVPRYTWIDVTYTTAKGKKEEKRFEGFLARIFLHEFDHLIGKLFIDHVESTEDMVSEQIYRSVILPSLSKAPH